MSRVGDLRRRWPAPATRGDSELLTISVAAEQSCVLVVLAGEADLTVSGRLGAALTAQVQVGTPDLVIDLSRLQFIDSSCLHVLARVGRMAGEADGTFGLAAPQPVVARIMQLWGAYRVIPVHASVAEAVIAAGAGDAGAGDREQPPGPSPMAACWSID